ncbi:hypothetical protein K461DRAFT_277348, partial [Myriangium duriaei CBS 260.36]
MSSPSPSPTPGISWHVPGPSSRYHKREYTHNPPKTSRPPSVLSTDAEHIRLQPTSTPHRNSRTSPPITHFSLSRRHTAPVMDLQDPLTPISSPHQSTLMHIQDSPFSDYFTDEARSAMSQKGAYAMPSPEVQQVLLRLNNLGAHMLRQLPTGDTFDAIAVQLDQLEQAISGSERGIGHRRSMRDSGFIDDFPDGRDDAPASPEVKVPDTRLTDPASPSPSPSPVAPLIPTSPVVKRDRHNSITANQRDRLLYDAQKLLQRVSKANTDLRSRFDEMRELSDQHAYQVEEATREVLNLRSENDGLKADLNFDHSELLFLKLQLKALEMQADGLYDEEHETALTTQKRVLLEQGVEQWKHMWDDIDARFRGRRIKHRVMSSEPSDLVRSREDGRSIDEQGNWQLDMSKKRNGRVQSITISRFNSQGLDGTIDNEIDVKDEQTFEDAQPGALAERGPLKSNQDTWTISIKTIHSQEGAYPEPGDDRRQETAASSKPVTMTMVDTGTQTTKLGQHAVRFSEIATIYQQAREEDSGEDDEEEEDETDEDEYAESAEDHMKEVGSHRASRPKTPWQELMDSVAEFTGLSNF